jgi:hypothetical protein
MHRLSARLLCQIYTLLVLLAAAATAPLPYLVMALVMLTGIIFLTVRPQPPRFHIVANVVVIFLTPLVLDTSLQRVTSLPTAAAHIMAVMLMLPVFYLFDDSLRENTRNTSSLAEVKGERQITHIYVSLLASALAVILIAPVVNRPVLLFSGIACLLYLTGVLIWTLFFLPRYPFAVGVIPRRIIAGTPGRATLYITSKAHVKMQGRLAPSDAWVQATPPQITFNGGKTRLDLSFTPPLAGQSRPQLRVSAIDPRGFLQVNQVLEPLLLHVIPMAKYAEWLARKYLEQAASGVIPSARLPAQVINRPKRGIEYRESRSYQPGDPLKDIDWKHTLKLSQLIVREYHEIGEQAAVIAVNLSVADAAEADRLAFNLITAGLTLARENIPTALAAYNHQSVVLNTPVIDPLEAVRQSLSLVKEITQVEFSGRLLEPADVAKIRRNINQLKQSDSEPARRLLDILNFEHRAIEEEARDNPATLALLAAARKVAAPAMILLISQLNHDAEAVLVTAEKLARRKFTTVPVDSA